MTTYEEVALAAKLDSGTTTRFIKYMRLRWPVSEERHCLTGYADEWAERFKGGYEYSASDLGGQAILRLMQFEHSRSSEGSEHFAPDNN